ncbi:hypothetical protein ACFQJ5_10035 [Halomicroarcula sp. GCM10025324]|uniref:hypothetical protein n=1 Tax=Haloarcula TaxID=2237 RepID=UPI0023E8CBC6|nr:hypothetical protein [Halomicroarcula sp. ZS-22-S1]
MGLEDFRKPKSDWMAEFENRVDSHGYSLRYRHISSNSHYFLLECNGRCVVGKTHHSREEKRDKSYISLNSVEEATWRDNPVEIPFTIQDDSELVDVFGIVIDHRSSNGYQQAQDNFLVLTEDILSEIPTSGKKEFRITTTGYRHPFGKHQNSWERLFKNLR